MRQIVGLAVLGAVGISLGVSCSGNTPTGSNGTGGSVLATGGAAAGGSEFATGGTGAGGIGGSGGMDAGCIKHYYAPGCGSDVIPQCVGTGGACFSAACSCSGKIIGGCQNEYAEPYAYRITHQLDASDPVGMTCDPNDGGQ